MKNKIIPACCALLLLIAGCNNKNEETMKTNEIFPKGEIFESSYFIGTVHLQMLMTNTEAFDCSIGNVTFEPGCRNNWHSHSGGQILLVTAGEGYYQEKGKPIQLIKKGDIIEILPNVVHWHGATPDSPMEHISITTKEHLGGADWGEPVTDEVYHSFVK